MNEDREYDEEWLTERTHPESLEGAHSLSSERTVADIFGGGGATESLMPPLGEGQILFDRYVIIRKLARGGFSDVYLAYDRELCRNVAIKRLLISGVDPRIIKSEAKTLASLDHPGIVQVYDVCHDDVLGYLMVMRYVPGPVLRELMGRPIPVRQAVEIAIRLSGALIHAHSRGITHRDVKPTNILMFSEYEPLLTDFGLAVTPDGRGAGCDYGTPRYMSPEQIRGEFNRIGPSSDIFSLGVVLYEMLCGRPPFDGPTPIAINNNTLTKNPKRLPEILAGIPAELDAICRRALRKNVKDRYSSMEAFQAELIQWKRRQEGLAEQFEDRTQFAADDKLGDVDHAIFNQEHTTATRLQFTHRGLQPFEETDARSFASLLPIDPSANALPESIRFWTQWIDSFDNHEYSRVGLLYGAGGSGKTSLLRAGIVPNLSPDVFPLYVDCRNGDLKKQVRLAMPPEIRLNKSASLTRLVQTLRDSQEKRCRKVVLLLDHFDTWARFAPASQLADCADALRHCDGENLQALLVIRVDYWTSAMEFLHKVECSIEHWKNVRAIELFDRHHARKLLETVGRACGCLPPYPEPLIQAQVAFMDAAISEMCIDGRIIPIQLAMFAKSARLHTWDAETLQALGGIQGACVGYLQDNFEGREAPQLYQRVNSSVIEILCQLLPSPDQALRSTGKSFRELEEALAREKLQAQVHRALRILVEDLRLVDRVSVTEESNEPVDCDNGQTAPTPATCGNDIFQISHEFLVIPISLWVNQYRKTTWKSRTLSRLDELAGMWTRKQHVRYMPTIYDYLLMCLALPRFRRNAIQRRYLQHAFRHQLWRFSLGFSVVLLAVSLASFGWTQRQAVRKAQNQQTSDLVENAIHGTSGDFKYAVSQLFANKEIAIQKASRYIFDVDHKRRTRALLLTATLSQGNFGPLAINLDAVDPDLSDSVVKAARRSEDSTSVLHGIYNDAAYSSVSRNRAAIVLAYLGETKPLIELLEYSQPAGISEQCVKEAIRWHESSDLWCSLASQEHSPGVTYHSLAVLSAWDRQDLPSIPWSWLHELATKQDVAIRQAADFLLGRFDLQISNRTPMDGIKQLSDGKELVLISPKNQQLPVSADILALVPKDPPLSYKVKEAFWLTCRPVTMDEFSLFLSDLPDNDSESNYWSIPTSGIDTARSKSSVAVSLKRLGVIKYCNWKSEKERRKPVYRIIGDPQASPDNFTVEMVEGADGFRLPTHSELALAMQTTFANPSLAEAIYNARNPSSPLSSDLLKRQFPIDEIFPNRIGVRMDLDGKFAWATDPDGMILFGTVGRSFAAREVRVSVIAVLYLACDTGSEQEL